MRGVRSEGNEPISSRYLVVGYGSIGRRHVANIRQLCPDAKIGVLRSGVSRDNVLSLQADGVDRQFWSAIEAIAFKPEAVVIASPASTHLEFGHIFASHGIPILIEKPLSHKLLGLSDFTSLIADGDMYVKVAYNLRFQPSLQYVRREILSGAIGDVLSVRVEVGQFLPDWRPEIDYRESVSSRAQMGGGALLELSHEIDYVLWIFGTPKSVTAHGGKLSSLELDVEDVVELLLEYESPAKLINIHLDFVQRAPNRTCRVIGSEGTLVWDGLSDLVRIFRPEIGVWECKSFPVSDSNQTYLDEMREFLFFREIDSGVLPDVFAACSVMRLIDAAKRSMASGKQVRVASDG